MTGTAERSPLEPNVDVMREYLELLFGGDRCAGMLDGLVEIAHGAPNGDGKPTRAQHFTLDKLDEAADYAGQVNRLPMVNCFVGMGLRKPTIALNKRTTKDDLLGVNVEWVDLDLEGAAQAMKERARFCLPSLVVVTGRKPYLRAQGIWRLDEPLTDVAEIEDGLRRIQIALNGDRAVVDASRVMRLPGSLAYPVKDGRVLELTELITKFDVKRPSIYPTGQVTRAFKPVSAGGEAPEPERDAGGDTGAGDAYDRNPFTGRRNAEALLRQIRPGNWHTPVRDFCAHMVMMGRADWEILAMLAPYCDPNHEGERPEDLIRQARIKWNRPNPDQSAEFDFNQPPPATLAPVSQADIVIKNMPRRPWLFGTWLLKGYLTMLIGTGGQGKSMLAIHAALTIAANRAWAGQKVRESGGVWIWNNEDDMDELRRRIGGTAKHLGIDLTSLDGKLFANSGVDDGSGTTKKLIVAVPGDHGSVIATPDVQAIVKHIKERGIKVLIVDPFVSTHTLNENDNPQMEAVTFLYRQIAQQADCAVMLVHHTSKPGDTDQAGNQHASRGASSITAAARVVITVAPMSDADAKKLMGEEYPEREREHCIRVDAGKANLSAPGKNTIILRKVGVSLENGSGTHVEDDADEIGGLEVADFSDAQHEAKMKRQDQFDRLKLLVAEVMQDIGPGCDLQLKAVLTRILMRTQEFGKERNLRDWVEEAILPAASGGVRIGDFLFHRWQQGTHSTATTYIGKRAVP